MWLRGQYERWPVISIDHSNWRADERQLPWTEKERLFILYTGSAIVPCGGNSMCLFTNYFTELWACLIHKAEAHKNGISLSFLNKVDFLSQPCLKKTIYIPSKHPSYSSSIIFHSPILRPPIRAIFPNSWRRFRYFRTWRADNPIESAIWTVLTLGFVDISLYIWRLAFMNSFVNLDGSFTNSFVNTIGSFMNSISWDALSVDEGHAGEHECKVGE